MPNYVLAFRGGSAAPTEAGQAAAMDEWMQWFAKLADAVVDGGSQVGDSVTVSKSGDLTEGAVSQLSGYSIIKAADLKAAADIAKGCPIFNAGGEVDVYETVGM
jgi:hypothetical protein